MKVAVFSTQKYDKSFLDAANTLNKHELVYFEEHLNLNTISLAKNFKAVCCFVNDILDANVIQLLSKMGVGLIALRSAGFNNVDLRAAAEFGITIVRVPAYSPYAVAEHAVGLILALNRKIHRAYNRVRESDFSLHGLMGFDLHGKTIGIIGTGKIGSVFANIMRGFGTTILAYDPIQNPACLDIGIQYVDLQTLYSEADIISLHCPLTENTFHMINEEAINHMKHGVMLINTSRGRTIDTKAVVQALKSGKIAHLGIDVYEEEGDLFFENLSDQVIQDDVFARLTTFPNVIITGHQAYFTEEAVRNIAQTTIANISAFEQGKGEMFIVDINQLS